MDSEMSRVASLERNVLFLQKQHRDTLKKLHEEIEELKRENKELHYRLIMEPQQPHEKGCTKCRSQMQLQSRDLSYPDLSQHSLCLHGIPSQSVREDVKPTASKSKLLNPDLNVVAKGSLITSLLPLRIDGGPTQSPRAPTLQECELVTQQLCNTNSLQSQELLRVKAILRDIVFNNKKMSPEAYTLTKAYLADSDRGEKTDRFPTLPIKSLPKKQPVPRIGMGERVILPAIKQSLSSNMAERQRKTQAVLKARLRKLVEMHHHH